MKFLSLLASLLLLTLTLAFGQGANTYAVGQKSFSITENEFSNTTFPVKVWYPEAAGTIVNDTFPVLTFGHGFAMSPWVYLNLFSGMAAQGYIVIVPDVQTGVSPAPDHPMFARQLAGCIKYIQNQSNIDTSFFHNRAGKASGSFGHSMGGGCTMIIPAFWSEINAIAGLAPAKTTGTPESIAGLQAAKCPVLLISGKGDKVAPEAAHQQLMYDATANRKLWVSMKGAGHCYYTDAADQICDFGATFSGEAPVLTHAQQQGTSLKYLSAFFNHYLKGDNCALQFLCGDSIAADNSITFMSNAIDCTNLNCTTIRDAKTGGKPVAIYPNPAEKVLTVQLNKGESLQAIYTVTGTQIIPQFSANSTNSVDVSSLSPGIYVLVTSTGRTARFVKN